MIFILASLVSVVIGVEHATDIEIHKVEVYEIPWQQGPSTPETAFGPSPQEYGPPQQEHGTPQQEYGPPQQEYGPPQQEYGSFGQGYDLPKPVYGAPPKPVYGPPPPEESATTTESAGTTESADSTTTEIPMTSTTELSANDTATEAARFQVREDRRDKLGEKGVYYVYHPDGLLQRVSYVTKDDARKMDYTAKLKYENVEPIREPIYSYDPNTLVITRISK
ncbi:unnamed protein product [Phaedon cochleariae]|uniref:Uncharacterized protein n=1 Tax=Phaedon cochleariae TaxID=80249 RepID=A0A9N9X4Z2_PHACE|nr:unnamed protein product [Phaedon cochleariae]